MEQDDVSDEEMADDGPDGDVIVDESVDEELPHERSDMDRIRPF
jgi:hypothetical protein